MNKKGITKIQALIVAIVIIVAAVAGGYYYYYTTTIPKPKPTIVIAVWGGAWQKGIVDGLEGFEEAYNCKVEYFIQSDSMETINKEIAEKEHPTIDVIMTGPGNTLRGMAGGVVEPVDPSLVPNLEDIISACKLVIEGKVYFVGNYFNYMGIAIRSDRIDASKVTSWKWLWSEDLYPKKLGMPTPEYFAPVEQTSLTWYGDVYHVDEAFEKLKELAPNIGLAYVDDALASEALAAGEINALMCYNVVATKLIKEGAPVKFIIPPGEKFFNYYNGPMVVKNGPAGKDLQMKMVNWLISPEAQIKNAKEIWSNPTNVKVTIPPDLAPYLLTTEQMAQAALLDAEFQAAHTDEWQERWATEIKPLLG